MAKSTISLKLPIKFLDEDTTVSRDKFCLNGRIQVDMSKIQAQLDSALLEKSLSADLYKRIKKMQGRYKK